MTADESTTEDLISHLRAQSFEHPLFTPLAQIWGTQNAGDTPSPERTYAEDVVLQMKRALKDQTEDATEIEHASESFPDRGSQTLRALFASVGLPDLLNNLLDSSYSYGQAFHKECEILWHDFGTQNQDERLRTDFLWVRAEYIRIKDELKVTREEHVIVTGQPGIDASYRLSSISSNNNKGQRLYLNTF